MTKYDKMKNLTNEILKIYREKNADYGDSFSKSYKEFGNHSSCCTYER